MAVDYLVLADETLPAAVHALAAERWAPNTRRAYGAAWRTWADWCVDHHASHLPATSATLAAYLADQAGRYRLSTLRLHVAAVTMGHRVAGHAAPTGEPVPSVLRGLARLRAEPPRQKRALRLAELRAAVDALPSTSRGIRDRAILLVGWASALRRSELAALQLGDVDDRPEGVVLRILRGKTDPEGHGRLVALPWGRSAYCPVRALGAWRALRQDSPSDAPLWTAVTASGRIGSAPLDDRTVCRIVQRAIRALGRDPREYGAHSLRAGFATEAAVAGIPERLIAIQTGHRSLTVLRSYVREATLFPADHPVGRLL